VWYIGNKFTGFEGIIWFMIYFGVALNYILDVQLLMARWSLPLGSVVL